MRVELKARMTRAWIPLLLAATICQASLVLGNEATESQADAANSPKFRLPDVAAPSGYELELEPDLDKFTFTGTASIAVKIAKETDLLTLNSKDLDIKQVTLSDGAAQVKVTHALKPEHEFLEIKAEKKLAAGKQYTLKVEYTGNLSDAKRGFYRSSYLDKDNKTKYVAVTHFEPTGARLAFPCWDEPAYKATFKISLKHPSAYTAISNMPPKGEPTPIGKDKSMTQFVETPTMSTYLVAFLVSDYGHKESADKKFAVWTKPSAVEQTAFALDVSEKLLKKLDEFTGISYFESIPKMDQATLKDFLPGAMENWGLVTYRERSLLFKEGVTTTRAKQNIASTIAHEFAHQWFGNLVSPKWWEFVWLNEGFADYFEYFITHEVAPEWRMNETFVVDNTQGNAFVADVNQNVRPMNKFADSPDEIKSLFDSIAYQKAGAVIRMMSHVLTQDVFQAGLRKYLQTYKGKAADSSDLLKVLQDTAGQKWTEEKVTFDKIMDDWINKPGYPVVTVGKNKDGDYVLNQERFLLEGAETEPKWWVPLTFVAQSQADFKNTTPVTWLKPKDQDLTISNPDKKGWVIFNTQQTGYYRVNYDEKNWEMLADYLQSKDFEKIHVLNRAQLIDDALNMARSGRLNYTVALTLTLYLNKEADYVPWQTTFRNLNFLHSMMRTSEKYDIFKVYVKYILKKLTKDVGFEPQKEENDLTKLLRINVLKWACRAGETECTEHAQSNLVAWLKNTTAPLDVDLENAIICAGVRSEGEATWNDTLKALTSSAKDDDVKKGLLSALACSESPVILKKYLLSTLQKNSSVTLDTAVQAVVNEHPQGADIALDVLASEYETIKKLNNSESLIKSVVDAIGGAVTNKDQFLQLSTLMVKQGLKADHLQNTVLKASKNIDWLQAYKGTIEDWLVTHEAHMSSANSLTFASFFVLLSIFITRFY